MRKRRLFDELMQGVGDMQAQREGGVALRTQALGVVKGYAIQEGGQWVAVCLDFCLAAQADTPDEAMEKLVCQIQEYVHDVVAGEDKPDAAHFLFGRKAPLSHWLTYYRLKWLQALRLASSDAVRLFTLPVPSIRLTPQGVR